MNKFELMNVVSTSVLPADDKMLLIELILRMDEEGLCWPSVERLCQVRGIKHEKNFKGVDIYLPGLVTKGKRGRRNFYTINTPAVEGLSQFEVSIKHTPSRAGLSKVNTPAVADDTPAVAENTPSVAGANSTLDSSVNNTSKEDSTHEAALADAPLPHVDQQPSSLRSLSTDPTCSSLIQGEDAQTPDSSLPSVEYKDTPAVEGVLEEPVVVEWDTYENEINETAGGNQMKHTVPTYTAYNGKEALAWSKAELTYDNVVFYITEATDKYKYTREDMLALFSEEWLGAHSFTTVEQAVKALDNAVGW